MVTLLHAENQRIDQARSYERGRTPPKIGKTVIPVGKATATLFCDFQVVGTLRRVFKKRVKILQRHIMYCF